MVSRIGGATLLGALWLEAALVTSWSAGFVEIRFPFDVIEVAS